MSQKFMPPQNVSGIILLISIPAPHTPLHPSVRRLAAPSHPIPNSKFYPIAILHKSANILPQSYPQILCLAGPRWIQLICLIRCKAILRETSQWYQSNTKCDSWMFVVLTPYCESFKPKETIFEMIYLKFNQSFQRVEDHVPWDRSRRIEYYTVC